MTGERLKEFIIGRGLSLAACARLLNMSPQHLNQALSAADVKSGLIEKLGVALGLSVSTIYGEQALPAGEDAIQDVPGELLACHREIELLRQLIETLKTEKAEYWEMIKELSKKLNN